MTAPEWMPDKVNLRDTSLLDDLGGSGRRIYTTAGNGYQRTEYTRTDIHQAALDRIAELEGAIREVVQGNVMDRVALHRRDGTPSKLDRCRHGNTHSAGCENCDAEYLSAVLAKGDG